MKRTKASRRAAGKKGAATRMRNQILAEQSPEDVHVVDQGTEQRTTAQDVEQSYGIDLPAPGAEWSRPSELEAPNPRPGMTQRWIRIKLGSEDDSRNSMRKFREGWLPRMADTVPEGYIPPTFSHPRLGNVIGVEDLILCEMPIAKAEQRNAFYRAKRDRMLEGIESDLRNVATGGPRISKTARTQVTKRRRGIPDPGE